jgi:hypothetical protein
VLLGLRSARAAVAARAGAAARSAVAAWVAAAARSVPAVRLTAHYAHLTPGGGAEQAVGHAAAAKTAYQRYLQLSPQGRYAAELRTVLESL